MKKTIKLFAFFLAVSSILMIQSCDNGEDINPAPTVSVDPTTAQNIPGGSVICNLNSDCSKWCPGSGYICMLVWK